MPKRVVDAIHSARVKQNIAAGKDSQRSLALQVQYAMLPTPLFEYPFAIGRRWKFDIAWPSRKLAVEIEGGAFTHGAHVRGRHFTSDLEKYNEAALQGWVLIRVLPSHVKDGTALNLVERMFALRADSEAATP